MKTRILLSKQQTTTQQQQQQQQQKPQHLNNIARNIQNINRFVDSASGHRHWTPHIPIIESENTLSRIADNTKCNSTKCRHMRLLMPVMCSRFIYPMCFRPMPKVAEPTEWLNVFFFFFFCLLKSSLSLFFSHSFVVEIALSFGRELSIDDSVIPFSFFCLLNWRETRAWDRWFNDR